MLPKSGIVKRETSEKGSKLEKKTIENNREK